MTVLDDLLAEVETYAQDHVELEVIDFTPSTGTTLNQAERATFRVQVTNRGPLNLTDVRVKVAGRGGATVAPGLGQPFEPSFVYEETRTVGAHGGFEVWQQPHLQAPDSDQPTQTLIAVYLEQWNVDLLHILNSHPNPAPGSIPFAEPKGTYEAEVVAQ